MRYPSPDTDGIWALETDGEARATGKLFFRCPAGAVQHPGDGDEARRRQDRKFDRAQATFSAAMSSARRSRNGASRIGTSEGDDAAGSGRLSSAVTQLRPARFDR